MENILLVIISLMAGIIMRQLKGVPSNSHLGLNAFIIYVSLPAITLYYVPKLDLQVAMLYPFLMPLLVLFASWLFFEMLGRHFKWPKTTIGALVLVAGSGNISFVGYPVIEALYGEEGLEVAIFVGQGGFLTISVIGILLASHYSAHEDRWKAIGYKLFTFPPFQAFVLALIVSGLGIEYPSALGNILHHLGDTLTPLAMASVGLQLQLTFKDIPWKEVGWGLGYKLLLAPMLIWLLYPSTPVLLLQVSVMEAAMPPMVTAAIIASQYQLYPKLANMLVGLGLLLSSISLALWWGWL